MCAVGLTYTYVLCLAYTYVLYSQKERKMYVKACLIKCNKQGKIALESNLNLFVNIQKSALHGMCQGAEKYFVSPLQSKMMGIYYVNLH